MERGRTTASRAKARASSQAEKVFESPRALARKGSTFLAATAAKVTSWMTFPQTSMTTTVEPISHDAALKKDDIPHIILKDTFDKTDAETLFPGRRVRFAEAVEQESPPAAEGEQVHSKTLNFPEVSGGPFESYHMVRGKKICGLLVDPGASSGLVGTDTLKELLASGMVPDDKVQSIVWGPSTTSVTGISGQSDNTLARISLPFDLDLKNAEYTADLIGGAGSTCPALLPNGSLRQLRTVMLTQWYDNGDGVMICSTNGLRPDHQDADLVAARLLLAESGHYILPVTKEDQTMTKEEEAEVLRLWKGKRSCRATAHEQNDMDKIKTVMTVAEDEEPIQVLKSDNLEEEYDETAQEYHGDQFPAHLSDGKLRYLSKLYKAIPEEFYSKTRRAPVTPRNARSWARKRKGAHFHLWEFCSGSGRLSFLALCAGLLVMFPLDYRYGWDLGCASHRKLIDEIETQFEPDVEYMSPACRPWSIASTRRDLEQTKKEREAETPTID